MMDRFVGVRIVQANGIDLSLFQFDFDLTFAAFFLNADKTIYGRYGTRSSQKEAVRDMSLGGFRKAMEGALALHTAYPANKKALAGKRGSAPRYKTPEAYPTLGKFKPTFDLSGKNAVKSCMHCHQIRDAERKVYRNAKKPAPDHVLFPWPMPDDIGMALDPGEKATVRKVAPKSIAARAGVRPGDEITSLEGQPILSIADVQWVLHNAKSTDSLSIEIRRGGSTKKKTLRLTKGWRRAGDITWRVTTWDIRRMGTGGMVLTELSDEERRELRLGKGKLGFRIKGLGKYPPHNVALRAGFKKQDVVVEFDGRSEGMTRSQLLAYTMQHTKVGEKVDVVVLRKGKKVKLKLKMQ